MSVKRWCGRAAAGSETATMNPMVEWHGDPDEDTPYVLASDYDRLREALVKAREDINWMLNNQKFLNGWVFDYIDAALGDGA